MNTVISKDGAKIAYDSFGAGPVLIYVTGALCYRTFEPVIADAQVLAQHFKVYIYDRRGRGSSDDVLPYSIEKEVEDIEALIDHTGGSAFVYGHSSGACLALEAALALGPKITKLALYEPPYNLDKKSLAEANKFTKQINKLLKADHKSDAVKFFMTELGMPEDMIEDTKQSPQWSILESLAPTIAYDSILSNKIVPSKREEKLKTPTLIMCGENSYEFMRPVAEGLSKSIRHAEFKLLKDQDHNPSADLLLPILKRFFVK